MEKYENLKKIYSNSYKIVYEGLNRHTNNLVIIKEINKNKKYSKHYKEEGTLLKSLNSDNIVSLIEEIETEDKYYLIMEKCMINLDDYLKMRIDPLSTDEIREILTQMNNALKIIKKKKSNFSKFEIN
jgi:serine/threonine protein kinase